MKYTHISYDSILKEIIRFIKRNSLLYFLDSKVLRRWYFNKENTYFLRLKRLERVTDIEKSKLQDEKLQEILLYAYRYSPYYRYLFDSNNIDYRSINCLQKIPFLTKDIIRKETKMILSSAVKRICLLKRNTGGSTGEPLEFFSDISAGAIDWAHHRYLFNLMGYKDGDTIVDSGGVFIPKSQRNKNIYWVKYAKNNLWSHVDYSALYFDDYTIAFYIKDILRTRPAILRGYSSFWNRISEYILLNGIKINFCVKGVNLTAEMCLLQQRENIEKAFSTKVFFEYGQSEMTVFCYTEDKTYTYKASPLYGYVEVIKDSGEYAQSGEKGEIVATSFCNRGMPFIRYRTGDIGLVAKRTGGLVYFKEILGRKQDYLISKNRQKVSLAPLTIGQHLSAFGKISNWQFIQEEVGKVRIKIVKLPGYSHKDEAEIKEKIGNTINIDLQFDYVDEITLTRTGKHLFLVQEIEVI